MSKPVNTIAFGASAVQPASGSGGWLLVMPAGTFTGRDGRGPFITGDRNSMQAIVDRTRAYFGGTDVMVDYDHQSAFGAIPGVGGTAKAAGWFKEFEVRDEGIFGRVEWTASAAAMIAADEYRYISPLFTSDKDTGRVGRIANAALVNAPALDLTAIAARAQHLQPHEDDDMKNIAKALGLADDASEAAILAAITDNHAKIAMAAGLKVDAKVAEVVATVTAFAADRGKIAVAGGLKADASTDELVTAMRSKVSVDGNQFVPMSMFTELQTELQALRTSTADTKAEDVVTEAMKAGKITPANKDWALNYAKSDLAGFNAFVGNQPTLTARQLTPAKVAGDGKAALDDTDLVVMRQMGLTEEQFIAARAMEAE